jgi:hypothetical protein
MKDRLAFSVHSGGVFIARMGGVNRLLEGKTKRCAGEGEAERVSTSFDACSENQGLNGVI